MLAIGSETAPRSFGCVRRRRVRRPGRSRDSSAGRRLEPRAYALAIGAALVAYGSYMLLHRPIVLKAASAARPTCWSARWAESPGRSPRCPAPGSRSGAACAAGTSSRSARCTSPVLVCARRARALASSSRSGARRATCLPLPGLATVIHWFRLQVDADTSSARIYLARWLRARCAQMKNSRSTRPARSIQAGPGIPRGREASRRPALPAARAYEMI